MTKLELIDALWAETGMTKNEASMVVNLFFNEMSKALADKLSRDVVEIVLSD